MADHDHHHDHHHDDHDDNLAECDDDHHGPSVWNNDNDLYSLRHHGPSVWNNDKTFRRLDHRTA